MGAWMSWRIYNRKNWGKSYGDIHELSFAYICNCPNTSHCLCQATDCSVTANANFAQRKSVRTRDLDEIWIIQYRKLLDETIPVQSQFSVSKSYLCGVIGMDRLHNWPSVLRSPGSAFRPVAFRLRSNTGRLTAHCPCLWCLRSYFTLAVSTHSIPIPFLSPNYLQTLSQKS